MKILIDRFVSNSQETIGRLFINGILQCYTLEDEFRAVKVHGETRIPAGTYRLGLRHSPKFSPKYGHEMLWVMDVPKFEFILIHKGNTDLDTHGCLLVGNIYDEQGKRFVLLNSRVAYDKIYPIISLAIKSGESVEIEYKDNDKNV